MKSTKKLTRALSLLLLLTMIVSVLSGAIVAQADGDGAPATTPKPLIDKTRQGSITVTKYATTISPEIKGTATGMGNDSIDNMYTTLKGVKFKLYQVKNADAVVDYYNGSDETKWTIDQFYTKDEENRTYTVTQEVFQDGAEIVWEKETDADGKLTFSGLPVGLYVLVEESYPDQISAGSSPSLISIPMVNTETSSNPGNSDETAQTDNRDWMYDINVFPKNTAFKSSVTITKKNSADNALVSAVEFTLQYVDLVQVEVEAADGSKELKNVVPTTLNWQNFTGYTSDNTTVTGEEVTYNLKTGTNGTLKIDGLTAAKYGTQYKLVEISAPDGYIANTDPLYFYIDKDKIIHWNEAENDPTGLDNKNPRVKAGSPVVTANKDLAFTLLNERADVSKLVKTEEDTWAQDAQHRLDDTLVYQLTVYVPLDIADMNTFTITDTPCVGIDDLYGEQKAKITYGETTIEANPQELAAVDGINGTGFTLEMTDADKSGITAEQLAAMAGTEITVEYSARMNADAVIAGVGNANNVQLEYSNVTGENATTTYKVKDTTKVYTYAFSITKYKDEVADGNELGEVEFELYDTENDAKAATNKLNLVDLGNGTYRLAVQEEEEEKTTVLVTSTDGSFTIQGLKNGDYWLKEIKTVKGYNLLSAPFKFTVGYTEETTWDTNNSGYGEEEKVNRVFGGVEISDSESATIVNKAGFVLPQTGSMGYLIFCAAGLLLIGGGAALIFGGRKKVIR